MYKDKKVLLIGGGGTLGTYTAQELLRLGCSVDVICLDDKVSDNKNLSFYKGDATKQFLELILSKKHYNGIVNFIHYPEVEDYRPIHKLLTEHTEHLIFLSSYRVYADLEHPITEKAPMLIDVTEDEEFLRTEKYAISKAKCEQYLRNMECVPNWTIVRPVISFSNTRFDILITSGQTVIEKTKKGEPLVLPKQAKNVVAGLDWAGNSGKLIANLLFKTETIGEAYTISSAQNLTWGEIAELYSELLGTTFEWVDMEEFWQRSGEDVGKTYMLMYDRLYDRTIDNSKVLKASGLRKEDFLSMKEGLRIELSKIL